MDDIEDILKEGVEQTKEMSSTLKEIKTSLNLNITLERDVKELFKRVNAVEDLSCEIKTAIYPNEILGKKSIFQEIIDIKKLVDSIDNSLDEKLKPINEKLNAISKSNIERNAVDKFKDNIPTMLLTLLSIISIVVSALNVIYKK